MYYTLYITQYSLSSGPSIYHSGGQVGPNRSKTFGLVMASEDKEQRRFARLATICLGLPEATANGEQHTAFLVRGRTFAYHLVDHHGDGRFALCCKAPAGENARLAAAEPARFFVPPYIGPKGWLGLDLDFAGADWNEIEHLVRASYRLVAPKSLAARVDS
jgi:hypothetical protein